MISTDKTNDQIVQTFFHFIMIKYTQFDLKKNDVQNEIYNN